jgi:predicted DCC family thiol-disulfide oxidoreductase YuxK
LAQGIVVFDDGCGFCQRSVRVLRALDRGGVYRYEGSSNAALLAELGITEQEADQELKFAAGGRVFGGYDGIVEALRGLPALGWVAALMRLAPVRWVGRKVYRRVAARRKCSYSYR